MKRWIVLASLFALALLAPSAKAQQRVEVARTMEFTVVVPAAPAPTGACAGTFTHCVIVSWTPPTLNTSGGAITGSLTYNVMRSTTSGTGYTTVTTSPVSTLTFEDDTVTSGTTYFYVVVAFQTISGTVSSGSANSVQASVFVPPVPPPNPPTAVTATGH